MMMTMGGGPHTHTDTNTYIHTHCKHSTKAGTFPTIATRDQLAQSRAVCGYCVDARFWILGEDRDG